ncbi:MAG: hypothetical protein EPN36_16045 [Rhodanobacteraceae bacterium]|nr:MAG: hypothetical protein EPN36_16045 [Rhodanobacteraceae bacterium]
MRTAMLCVPARDSKKDAGPAGPASSVLRHYFFLRRAAFLAAFFAGFLAAFFLAPPFFTALRVPFLTALRAVFLAALRAPFLTALRAVFLAAFFLAAFLAGFFAAFLAAGFLAAFFFFAGFLAAGLAAAGAGAAGAAGSSVMLHGNVVSLLIGCSSGWIVDSGPLVILRNGDARRRDPFSHNGRMVGTFRRLLFTPFFVRSSLIAASAQTSFPGANFGQGKPERASCPDFSQQRLRREHRAHAAQNFP